MIHGHSNLFLQVFSFTRSSPRVLQLDLFLSDARAYRDALARYEMIRPVLRRERTLAQHSRITGVSYWQLWRDHTLSRRPNPSIFRNLIVVGHGHRLP
jgi:hypothetical protein